MLLIHTTVPPYRVGLVEALSARFAAGSEIVSGAEYFDPTIRHADEYFDPTIRHAKTTSLRRTTVQNRFFAGRRLLWQSGVWRRSIGVDVVIAELNPRVLSTWAVMLTRRLLRRPTILWGHAWSRRGRYSSRDPARHVMRLLSDAIIAYSETQANELREKMPRHRVVAAPNALYARSQQRALVDCGRMRDFLFVGRLIEAKKPRFLTDAFVLAVDDLPPQTNLVFVGEGPLREELEDVAERSSARDRIHFLGEITEPNELANVYGDALASVIPGYAGLSLIQSLWFGVPSAIARDEPHSPEIEAAIPGTNAIFFRSDSLEALRATLIGIARDRDTWIGRRRVIAHECARRYSIESMVESVAAVVEAVLT